MSTTIMETTDVPEMIDAAAVHAAYVAREAEKKARAAASDLAWMNSRTDVRLCTDEERATLAVDLADAVARLDVVTRARDARAAELAQARSDAAAAQTAFEDGDGNPVAAAQARAMVDVLASALTKNDAAVAKATSEHEAIAARAQRAEDLAELARLARETVDGVAAMKQLRSEILVAFSERVGEFRALQHETGAKQARAVELLLGFKSDPEVFGRLQNTGELVQVLGHRGVEVSALHLQIDPAVSPHGSREGKTPHIDYPAVGGWESRSFDQLIGR